MPVNFNIECKKLSITGNFHINENSLNIEDLTYLDIFLAGEEFIHEKALYRLKNLKTLKLFSNKEYRIILNDVLKLTCLEIKDGILDNKVFQHLPNLLSLTLFGVGYSENLMTDKSLEKLTNLTELYVESYGNSLITDRGLKCLNHVGKLHLFGGNFTIDGINHMTNIELLGLRKLNECFDRCLKNFPNLTTLDLGNGTKCGITDDGLMILNNSLKNLSLFNDTSITDEGLKYCPGLKTLALYGKTNITDKGMQYIAGNNLTELSIVAQNNNMITDISMFPNLIKLDLSRNKSKYGLELDKIEELYLDFNNWVTYDSISHFRILKRLNLICVQFDPNDIQKIRKANENIYIVGGGSLH